MIEDCNLMPCKQQWTGPHLFPACTTSQLRGNEAPYALNGQTTVLIMDMVLSMFSVLWICYMKWMVFKATILHCKNKTILGWWQSRLMRWILVWIMPQMQDQSLNLLTYSLVHHHCAMAALWLDIWNTAPNINLKSPHSFLRSGDHKTFSRI